jgi:hypothetical protein
MNVGYIDFDDGSGSKQYAYAMRGGRRVFLRNVAFITNPARTKLLVVHNKGEPMGQGWEPPKGLSEWVDFADASSDGRITVKKYNACLRAAMEREVVEEAKVLPNELQNVQMMPYAFFGICDVQHNQYMYQFWTATITEQTMKKAQQRQRTLHTNSDWLAMVPADIQETDDVAWWDSNQMRLTQGPAEKMIAAYLRLMN